MRRKDRLTDGRAAALDGDPNPGRIYPTGNSGGGRYHALCRWPGCDAFATREVDVCVFVDPKPLCPTHRVMWDALSLGEIASMAWQPRRSRQLTPAAKTRFPKRAPRVGYSRA